MTLSHYLFPTVLLLQCPWAQLCITCNRLALLTHKLKTFFQLNQPQPLFVEQSKSRALTSKCKSSRSEGSDPHLNKTLVLHAWFTGWPLRT